MATVTGLTAARMIEIEDASVVSGTIDEFGHLILTTHGGTEIDAGSVEASGIPDASETVKGLVELATTAEVDTGTDTVRAVTPAGLASITDPIEAALAATQPLDDDLTAISGLSPANNDVLQRKSGAWANRTIAQLVTDLLATGSFVSPATPTALTDGATIAVDAAVNTNFKVTLGGNRTLGNPTNSTDGRMLLFAIRQDATGSRTLTLGSNYRLGTDINAVVLSTLANKTDYLGVRYNSADTKWDVIAFVKGY